MKKGFVFILVTAILFSTSEIILKIDTGAFNAIQFVFLRFGIGSIVLLPFAIKSLKKQSYHLSLRDFLFLAFTGFICVVVSMIFYQMAIVYLQAAVVAVLFCCNPVFVVIFAFLLLHNKIYRHTIISLIISIAGIIVIMNPFHMTGNPIGFVFLILSTITFAFYSVIGRKRSSKFGGLALTCFSFLFGSIELLILILITNIPVVARFFSLTNLKLFSSIPIIQGINLHSLPALLFAGILVTGIGYTTYFLSIEATSNITASIAFFIKPALAPILAFIFINESLTLTMIVGISLIIIGALASFIPDFRMQNQRIQSQKIKRP
ncbi:MAG TPA: EamA family transporter [Ruminococcaceae bacterium]|nr:EamA family transporter [Oscillospiraceae bacterium]